MRRLLVVAGLMVSGLAGALAWWALPARAADSKPLNLITSPLPINLSIEPGKTVTTELKVKQGGSGTEQLQVSLMKFAAFGSEGKPRLMDREAGDDYFDWVKFDKPTFDAPSNVWQTVKMTVTVPKNAAFGYYYAVVFSRLGDEKPAGANTNAIHGGSAVLVLLDAKVPGAKREVAIESFTSKHGVYEFLPADFNVKLHNTGNVHVVPHGTIFLTKGKKQIGTVNLNDEQGNILPNSRRIYPVEWKDSFPHFEKIVEDGKVKLDRNNHAMTRLVWLNGDGETKGLNYHLRMGHYTAHLIAVYDDGARDVPLEAELSFWVIPWKLILGLLAGLVVAYLVIRFALRRYRKSITAQVRRQYER